VGGQMSRSRLVAGLAALALAAAAVTALAGANPDVRAEITPAPKADVAPAAKGDRPAMRPAKPQPRPVESACPQEPWPYGCQWRVPPARKVMRGSRPG
jgi:hypothetical protein